MKKSAISTILAPALSAVFLLSAGCETKEERKAAHAAATEMLVTYFDRNLPPHKTMDLIPVKDVHEGFFKVKELAKYEKGVGALIFNGSHIVGQIRELSNGSFSEWVSDDEPKSQEKTLEP